MNPEHLSAGVEPDELDHDNPAAPLLAELRQFVAHTRSRIQSLADSIERCDRNRGVAPQSPTGSATSGSLLTNAAIDGDPAERLNAIKRRLTTQINQSD